MLSSVFLKSLRDNRYTLVWYGIGLVALSFYLMYFFPFISKQADMLKVLDNLPPFIRNLFGKEINISTPEGFFNLQPFSMMAPLIFLIFAISKGGDAVAGERERGTLDLLLANPVSRARVVVEKFAAIFVSLLLLAFIFWVGMTLGGAIFSVSISSSRLAEAIVSCMMLGACFAALTLALGALSLRKKWSVGIVSGFGVVAYLVNAYAPMAEELQPYRVFSPFYYYNGASPVINGLDPLHFLVLAGLTLLFFILSIIFFERRDFSV